VAQFGGVEGLLNKIAAEDAMAVLPEGEAEALMAEYPEMGGEEMPVEGGEEMPVEGGEVDEAALVDV
jgi:hypothetical protein